MVCTKWPPALVALALFVSGCVSPPSETRRSDPEFPKLDEHSLASKGGEEAFSGAVEAARFRYAQRLSEGGVVPERALERALEQLDAMRHARSQPRAAGIYSGSWSWIGPGHIGGRLRAILIHPTQTNTMWVGTAAGGIWKTTNGGTTWSPMDDFMATLAIGCMALDPVDPNVLYAGTGEGFFDAVEGSSNTATMRGSGIFKSVDGGQTWDRIPSTATPDFWFVNRLAIDPTNPSHVLAATSTGIWRSTNGGASWSLRASGWFLDLQRDPNDSNHLVAGKSHVSGFVSFDNGSTWSPSTGLNGDRHEFAFAASAPGTVYAAVSNSNSIKIYRSTDGGLTYSLRTSGGGIGTYAHYNNTLWVDPTNADNVIVGGVYLYRSTNGGTSLSQTLTAVHADMHAIVPEPGFDGVARRRLFIGCDGGIYRVDNAYVNGATRINNNLGVTQFYGAAVNANGVVLAGAQDNGTNRYTGDPMAWNSNVIGGDGGFCASDPFNANYLYGGSQYAGLRRSSNAGASFSGNVAPPGAGSANNFNFIPFFLIDPNEGNRMLVCGEVLWRNNAVRTSNTWSSIKPSIRPSDGGGSKRDEQAHFADNNPWNISTVAVQEGNSNVIWAGHNDGHLYKTSNGTAGTPAWTRVDRNGVGLPERWISRIVIDRADSDRVTVSVMGWEADNLWRTDDGGATWTPVVGSGTFALPSVPVSALAQNRTKPQFWYAGTDLGIFTSSDDGATWTNLSDGPGIVPIDELVWKDDSTLMAVTHGRGVWLAAVSPVEPFSPGSFVVLPGIHESGRLQQLFLSDDRYVVARRNLGADEVGYTVQIDCEGVAPLAGGTGLTVRVESRVDAPGIFRYVDLFDFTSGTWVRLSGLLQSMADSQVTTTAPPPVSRFIQAGTRKVRVRLGWSEVAAETSGAWRVFLDELLFTLTP